MSKRTLFVGLALYCLFLFVQLPAAWMISWLPATFPLQPREADGRFWHGQTRLAWRADGRQLELGRLTWDWRAADLLKGRMGFTFELAEQHRQLRGVLLSDGDGLHLEKVEGSLDAAVLGFAVPSLSLLDPGGRLDLDIPDLYLGRNRIHGAARADWLGARGALVPGPLGDYRLELKSEPDGRRARYSLHTLQGALGMSGEGTLSPTQGLVGRLILQPPQDARRGQYTAALSLLGQPNASGAWVLNLERR